MPHTEDKPKDIVLYGVSWMDQVGNMCADAMADKGAELNQVLPTEAESYNALQSTVINIQQRLLALAVELVQAFPTKKAEQTSQAAAIPPVTAALICTNHVVVYAREQMHWRCARCATTPVRLPGDTIAAAVRQWLSTQCEEGRCTLTRVQRVPVAIRQVPLFKGRAIHDTHVLHSFRGIIFCSLCGAYVAERMRNLAVHCKGAQRRASPFF